MLSFPNSIHSPGFNSVHSTRAIARAAITAPAEPVICFAPPVNGDGDGLPAAVGLVEFPAILLTIRDGHGVLSGIDGLDLVTMTSGAGPEGQAVPQGARTVDCQE